LRRGLQPGAFCRRHVRTFAPRSGSERVGRRAGQEGVHPPRRRISNEPEPPEQESKVRPVAERRPASILRRPAFGSIVQAVANITICSRGPRRGLGSFVLKDRLCGTCRKSAPNARVPTHRLGRAFASLSSLYLVQARPFCAQPRSSTPRCPLHRTGATAPRSAAPSASPPQQQPLPPSALSLGGALERVVALGSPRARRGPHPLELGDMGSNLR
jgi:hypothetical protein